MIHKKFFILIIFFWLLTPTIGLTREYFLYDHEKNVILNVKDNLKAETIKTIGLNKNPNMMMATGISEQYLAVFDSQKIGGEKGETFYEPGKIIIFNAKVDRTNDFLEIGFAPYQWVYTKDRLHFFIAYYPSPKKEAVEFLHYDFKEQKATKIQGIACEIVDLQLTYDENALLAIIDSGKSVRELLKFQITPFQLKSRLEIGARTERLYTLGPDRVALISINKQRSRKSKPGTIKIIDTFANAVVEERKLFYPNTGAYWYENSRSLFVTNGILNNGLMEGRIYRITGGGIRQHQISRPWAGFSFLPDQGRLYILNDTTLTLIDYPNNFSRTYKIDGPNYYPGQFHYFFQRLPQTDLAIIACFEKGYLKFYDLENNLVLKSVKCGRSGKRFINSITFKGDLQSKTAVTTNQWQSRFYVLNRATQDITVYDQEYDLEKYLVPQEPPLAMFQINQPNLYTLVVTTDGLYKIDEENVNLVQVADFSMKISQVHYFEEKDGVIFLYTNGFLMVLESENIQVKHCFYLYGDPSEKYTKLNNNERRFYFIPEL